MTVQNILYCHTKLEFFLTFFSFFSNRYLLLLSIFSNNSEVFFVFFSFSCYISLSAPSVIFSFYPCTDLSGYLLPPSKVMRLRVLPSSF